MLIITINNQAENLAQILNKEWDNCSSINYKTLKDCDLSQEKEIIFIGALGICIRTILPLLRNKYVDPAVVCVDTMGRYAISVASGHVGGANDLARKAARILGAQPIITTQSDNAGLWALDTLGQEFGWTADVAKGTMNKVIFAFVNQEPVALLLEVKDNGTTYLERTAPAWIKIFKHYEEIPTEHFKAIIAVTPRLMKSSAIPLLCFRPRILHLGIGCRKDCPTKGVAEEIARQIEAKGWSPLSVASISTIALKEKEPAIHHLSKQWQCPLHIFSAQELSMISVPHPSEKVRQVTGVDGVAESAAIKAAQYGPLLIEKQKCKLSEGGDFTFALAQEASTIRQGHIEFVGAGPGDPELISVRGKHFLEMADLILYAGSLVPEQLTHYAQPGCTVRSSATMTLEEQFQLMKSFYDDDKLVVRLHTGDPCIYGAIEEQMALMDEAGMNYHITPGISAFQAAAAALKSQFTIPEEVQTIILTRGEGRTPMPEREQLHRLAKSQSTMCIYLSASIVEKVQEELLESYPPDTPVAACYKLTWKDEQIYRGQLKDLARIVKENKLSLTTLLVVGRAIGNREGVSRLYHKNFKHLFRP